MFGTNFYNLFKLLKSKFVGYRAVELVSGTIKFIDLKILNL